MIEAWRVIGTDKWITEGARAMRKDGDTNEILDH
ncbi:MAG: hypothetical protein EZS28_010667, partial [Streblomastix strix]